MNFLLAPDSFKGSMTSAEAAESMAEAVRAVDSSNHVKLKPMADGGEGTLDALMKAGNGESVAVTCNGPLGKTIESCYVILDDQTAVIECASISGLPMISEGKRNPDHTTTYGIGEAILHALDRGVRSFIIGLGGSSTNDGGMGMLQALGMKAFDNRGNVAGKYGKDFLKVEDVDFSELDSRLQQSEFKVACDVDNPLTGDRGASFIFGPQKGATGKQVIDYDQAMTRYGKAVEKALGKSMMDTEGAGAAGGLGFALLALGGKLQSGAELVGKAVGLQEAVQWADVVITGEGQSDRQTLYGKAPGYVASQASLYGKPTILLSGSITGDFERLNEKFLGCFSIVAGPNTLKNCMKNGHQYLYNATSQLTRLIMRWN
ncbi:glycerate kinase [Thalassobacillus pellis]|uniref:glycerate kinase n=1 Tax=Thalassobacillus pellis TaxID=748008 RepID=UPI00196178FD|nr:glycerate kinase [Thalassobacillus pellis]